jgi:hypothetical protein
VPKDPTRDLYLYLLDNKKDKNGMEEEKGNEEMEQN